MEMFWFIPTTGDGRYLGSSHGSSPTDYVRLLRRLAALIHSVRLSLMKGARADLSSKAWKEIGVKPGFGLSGIPQHSTLRLNTMALLVFLP